MDYFWIANLSLVLHVAKDPNVSLVQFTEDVRVGREAGCASYQPFSRWEVLPLALDMGRKMEDARKSRLDGTSPHRARNLKRRKPEERFPSVCVTASAQSDDMLVAMVHPCHWTERIKELYSATASKANHLAVCSRVSWPHTGKGKSVPFAGKGWESF